jgi:hypothetical protein
MASRIRGPGQILGENWLPDYVAGCVFPTAPTLMRGGIERVLVTGLNGHDTGIFSWDYLYFLGSQQEQLWADYLARLETAGVDRDAPMPGKAGAACGSH